MKKALILTVLLCLVLSLAACDFGYSQDSVVFYYPRNPDRPTNTAVDTFYAGEKRETSGHTSDLRYLLSLYLQGPLSDDLVSPFPQGTQILDLQLLDRELHIRLNEEFSQLGGMDLTLACACISITCFDLADVDRITITAPATETSPAVEVTLTRQDLLLTDTLPKESQSE